MQHYIYTLREYFGFHCFIFIFVSCLDLENWSLFDDPNTIYSLNFIGSVWVFEFFLVIGFQKFLIKTNIILLLVFFLQYKKKRKKKIIS